MIKINEVGIADLPWILEIERASQLEPWSREAFLKEMERSCSRILVARMQAQPSRLSGYICFWEVADEIQVQNIAVHPGHRRRGIATALLFESLRYGQERKCRCAVLEVHDQNIGARKLYENFGFRCLGERQNYYCDGGSALLMQLDLDKRALMKIRKRIIPNNKEFV